MRLSEQFLFLGLLGLMLGCDGGNSLPKPVKVSGKVVYQGAPLADVLVTFHPAKAPSPSSGSTNDAGEFELQTYAPGDGAFPGKHKITLAPKQAVAPTAAPIALDSPEYAKAMEEMMAAAKAAPEKPRFPVKYGSVNTTDLEFEVKVGEPNQASFELKD